VSPRHWWRLRNPWTPSWGESFAEIRTRMLEAISDALASAAGRNVVLVSHQTPVLVARLALAQRGVPPWLGRVACSTGSVSTIRLEEGIVVKSDYFAPGV
jgi:broad specificity phosphatase PhoE